MNKKVLLIIIILALIGAILSTLLLFQHYSQAEASALVNMLCGGDSAGGCEKVNQSPYSSAAGLPLAAIGIMFYLSIGLLAAFSMMGNEKTTLAAGILIGYLSGFAILIDVILLALQIFSIGAFCIVCISTYLVSIAVFVLLVRIRKQLMEADWKETFRSQIGRVIFTSWLAGSLLLVLAVAAVNYALSFKDPAILQQRLTESAYNEYAGSPVQNIDLTGVPYLGTPDSPIKIVVYSDFLCPFCRQMAQYFQQYVPRWRDKVVLYYISYPLDMVCNEHQKETYHQGSCWLAIGGICAQQQGKFWLYHDFMFNKKIINPGHQDVIKFGKDLGMDSTAFAQCLFSPPMRNMLRQQLDNASAMGVASTPRIFVNGRLVAKIGDLQAILGKEAERLGIAPLPGLNE
jgi:uncharacterized membrane protein/protein-disulfide isomerase